MQAFCVGCGLASIRTAMDAQTKLVAEDLVKRLAALYE